jgi:hypothetical protein
MGSLLWIGLALWWGIFTSIQPRPLATHIAAVSYVARRIDRPRVVVLSGLLYTLGHTAAYIGLGIALTLMVRGGFDRLDLPDPLSFHLNRVLGPLVIVVAVVLLEFVWFGSGGGGLGEKSQQRVDAGGVWGTGLLGAIIALSFCPLSAWLFFGTMIPVALRVDACIVLPLLYGIGTSLPVAVFVALVALSTPSVGKAYGALSRFSWWARRITGAILLIVGLHFTLVSIFAIDPFWFPWLK